MKWWASTQVSGAKQTSSHRRYAGVSCADLCHGNQSGEREGGKTVLQHVQKRGKVVSQVHIIWVDEGFDGSPFMQWVMTGCHWVVQVMLRPEPTKGFVLLKKTMGGRADFRLVDAPSSLSSRLRVTARNF